MRIDPKRSRRPLLQVWRVGIPGVKLGHGFARRDIYALQAEFDVWDNARDGAPPDNAASRVLRSISGRRRRRRRRAARRSKIKNTSPAALTASDTAWIMLKEEMP